MTPWCAIISRDDTRSIYSLVSHYPYMQIRVQWLGLMLEETRQQAVLCCDRCLDYNIPVDIITSEALRVKNALE